MKDRELLEEMFHFMVKRNFIVGDEKSVRDMVLRYKQPPLTLHHRVAMQMTVQDYANLEKLLERVVEHFNPNNITEETVSQPIELWNPESTYFVPDEHQKIITHDPA